MLFNILFLIVGFIILIKGADILVAGSSSLAKKFGLSGLMIGLTVVAFGTSAPELIVNIFSSIAGSSDIGMGNIIGSNISNILLILGISAIICNLQVADSVIKKQLPFSILSILVLFFLINSTLFNAVGSDGLYPSGGFILLIFFAIFLYFTFSVSKRDPIVKKNKLKNIFKYILLFFLAKKREKKEEDIDEMSIWKILVFISLGMAGLFIGGKFIVNNATELALGLGLSQAFIGLTVVALGTSLPELAASIIAARKNQIQMAVGNVIGSNIFNLLWILGISSIINPIGYNSALNFDILFLIFISCLLFGLIYMGKRFYFTKKEGYILVALYLIYLVFISFRG
jgi:cation:H+ antiporter